MSAPDQSKEFTCAACGSPIPTTAAPGEKVTCNCCGAVNVVPSLSIPEDAQADQKKIAN